MVSIRSETAQAQNSREEEEQDEEDTDYAGEKHPASPAVPRAVAVVAVAAIQNHVSTRVERIQNDERMCRSSKSTGARNRLTGYNNHNTGEVGDWVGDTCLRTSRSDG